MKRILAIASKHQSLVIVERTQLARTVFSEVIGTRSPTYKNALFPNTVLAALRCIAVEAKVKIISFISRKGKDMAFEVSSKV